MGIFDTLFGKKKKRDAAPSRVSSASSFLEYLDKSEGTDELYQMLRSRPASEIKEACKTFPIETLRLDWDSTQRDFRNKRFELITAFAQILVQYKEIRKQSPELRLPRSLPAKRLAETLMSRLMPFISSQSLEMAHGLRIRLYDFGVALMQAERDRDALTCFLASRPSIEENHDFWICACRSNIAQTTENPDDISAAIDAAEQIVSGRIRVPERSAQRARQMLSELEDLRQEGCGNAAGTVVRKNIAIRWLVMLRVIASKLLPSVNDLLTVQFVLGAMLGLLMMPLPGAAAGAMLGIWLGPVPGAVLGALLAIMLLSVVGAVAGMLVGILVGTGLAVVRRIPVLGAILELIIVVILVAVWFLGLRRVVSVFSAATAKERRKVFLEILLSTAVGAVLAAVLAPVLSLMTGAIVGAVAGMLGVAAVLQLTQPEGFSTDADDAWKMMMLDAAEILNLMKPRWPRGFWRVYQQCYGRRPAALEPVSIRHPHFRL